MQTFEGWIASLQVFSVQNKIRRSLLYNFAYHLKSNGRPWLLQTFFTLLEKVKKNYGSMYTIQGKDWWQNTNVPKKHVFSG